MSKEDICQLLIDVDAATQRRLDVLAKSRRQSAALIVAEAIENFLDRVENLTEAERAAIATLERQKQTGLHLTAEEVDAWLAQLEADNDIDPPQCHR